MNGMYNIKNETEGCTYYQTVRRLPSMSRFYEECGEIADLLRRVIGGYLEDAGFPEYNETLEPVFDKDCVGEFPSDRTMCFFLNDLDAFTPDFIRLLQERVLAQFPLWRLLAQFDERVFGVYPQGAWLGDHWVDGAFDENHPAYRTWLQDAEYYREKRYGPIRRQLAFVRQMIPAAMARASKSGFALVAAFDCFPPYFPGHAIWLLQTVSAHEMLLDINSAPLRKSAVAEDGSIYPQYWEEFDVLSDVSPPFWLITYVVDPASSYEFAMKSTRGELVGTVSVTDIVRDDALRNLEEGG